MIRPAGERLCKLEYVGAIMESECKGGWRCFRAPHAGEGARVPEEDGRESEAVFGEEVAELVDFHF